MVVAITILGGAVPHIVSAASFDYLPENARELVEAAEEAREAWEARKAEVEAGLTIEPWETDEEFEERVEEAVEVEAAAERRYLEFRLDELRYYEFSSEPAELDVDAGDYDRDARAWDVTVAGDLGFLDDVTEFEFSYSLEDADDRAAKYERFSGLVEDGAVAARARYALRGNMDGEYFIRISGIELLDESELTDPIHTASLNRGYEFSRDQRPSEFQPDTAFDFADGRIPSGLEMSGDADWRITGSTYSTVGRSLQAGDITHNQETTVSYSGEVPAGSTLTEVSFARRVSSEANFDFLKFFVNGTEIDSWSGEVDWGDVSYSLDVPAGEEFELSWSYVKDYSIDEGQDTAWIDDIRILFE